MSARFSVLSWLSRLNDPGACIVGRPGVSLYGAMGCRDTRAYYALAEDRRGNHYPYPKLPRPLRFIFRATVVVHNRRGIQHPVRGMNWWFIFPCCGARSEFKPGGFRNNYCACGAYFPAQERGVPPIWSVLWWWERFPYKWRNLTWKLRRPLDKLRGWYYDFKHWTDQGDVPF